MEMQEIILDIMQKEGVSKAQLAKAIGVTRQAMSQMLTAGDMKLSTVTAILSALGYEIIVDKKE